LRRISGDASLRILEIKTGSVILVPEGSEEGFRVIEDLFNSACEARPSLIVVLYGTGVRNNSGLANVAIEIGGAPEQVAYAGANSAFDGLDQTNVTVPRSLAGTGQVPLILTIDGITASVVTLAIQ